MVYEPKNIDDKYLGPISMSEALYKSRNAATVRLAEDRIGRSHVIELARKLNLPTEALPNAVVGLFGLGRYPSHQPRRCLRGNRKRRLCRKALWY